VSRHIPRKARWARVGPNEYVSTTGRVYFRAGEWQAEFTYRVLDPESTLPGAAQSWHAGRFKRPRNAMIALEDKVTELERRYGTGVVCSNRG
jgi:hypothetical protein